MDTLRKPCESCHKPMNGGLYRAPHICPHCGFEHATNKKKKSVAFSQPKSAPKPAAAERQTTEYDAPPVEVASEASGKGSIAKERPGRKEPLSRGPAGLPEVEEDFQEPAPGPIFAEPAQPEAEIAQQEPEIAQQKPESAAASDLAAADDSIVEVPPAAQAQPEPEETTAYAEPEVAAAPTATAEPEEATEALDPNRARDVALTTKPAEEQNVVAYFEHVTSEQVITLPLTADLFEGGKFLGTKSQKVKAVLQQGKKQALADLRNMAYDMGANMVASINLENKLKVIDKQTAEVTVVAVGSAISAELVEEAMEA